jgi:hypothetical protein
MNFLSDLIINPSTVEHAVGQFYVKVDNLGKVVKTVNVQETDPTVSSFIKAITTGNINQWNQAFSWGNHSGLYSLLEHNHTIADILNLSTELAGKSPISHSHLWSTILEKPDFNNRTQKIQIASASLSGNGTIESQVATYINTNVQINRTLVHGTLFIEITDYDSSTGGDETPNPTTEPGITTVTSGLTLYYDFGASNWFVGSGSTIRNFANSTNGTASGGSGHNSEFGGFYNFVASSSRFINTNMNYESLGITTANSLVFVAKAPNVSGTVVVFGAELYQGNTTSLHCGFRQNRPFRGHFAADVVAGGTGTFIDNNTWYHIVFTQDAGVTRVYVNGNLVTTAGQSFLTNNLNVFIGRWQNGYYNVDVGLSMVYSKQLSSEEVTTLYNEQKTRFSI